MKLISMTKFVLEQKGGIGMVLNFNDFTDRICNYAKFLSQPLQLGFFVPCDLEGNVLSEPKHIGNPLDVRYNSEAIDRYNEAKERVLFEGFEYSESIDFITVENNDNFLNWHKSDKYFFFYKGALIEDLIKYDLTLTESEITKIKGV